jgi:hypothetical protein
MSLARLMPMWSNGQEGHDAESLRLAVVRGRVANWKR